MHHFGECGSDSRYTCTDRLTKLQNLKQFIVFVQSKLIGTGTGISTCHNLNSTHETKRIRDMKNYDFSKISVPWREILVNHANKVPVRQ
jgi:hypothetical protein